MKADHGVHGGSGLGYPATKSELDSACPENDRPSADDKRRFALAPRRNSGLLDGRATQPRINRLLALPSASPPDRKSPLAMRPKPTRLSFITAREFLLSLDIEH